MEILDIYDSNGNLTGRTMNRDDLDLSLKEGDYVAISQIYIENDEGKFLIEETAKNRGDRFLPAGGHISSGEDAYTTIIREVEEELGLDISNDNVVSLGFVVDSRRVRFIYYLKKNVDINSLSIQPEEVKSINYLTADEIRDYVQRGLMHKSHEKILEKVLEYKNNII